MKFPTMVYRCPGAHQCQGGTYDFRGVWSQAEFDDVLVAGWSVTLPEAMSKKYGLPAVVVLQPVIEESELEVLGDEVTLPTRAELEQEASKLGIKVKKNMTDVELFTKINESLRN